VQEFRVESHGDQHVRRHGRREVSLDQAAGDIAD
jgi:hypothetical protein